MTIQHSAIPDAQLHEPKGVASAVANTTYIANGGGSGSWAWLPESVTLDIATLNAVADYYVVIPYAATITKMYSVIDSAIATADKVLTLSIAGTPVTGGALTIAFSGSAAGDVDSCTPSAANAVAAGQALKIAATGGSTGDARGHLTIVYTRTA